MCWLISKEIFGIVQKMFGVTLSFGGGFSKVSKKKQLAICGYLFFSVEKLNFCV